MGEPMRIVSPPNGETYADIKRIANSLYESLDPYGVRDMVDVQSLIWVCSREAKTSQVD